MNARTGSGRDNQIEYSVIILRPCMWLGLDLDEAVPDHVCADLLWRTERQS